MIIEPKDRLVIARNLGPGEAIEEDWSGEVKIGGVTVAWSDLDVTRTTDGQTRVLLSLRPMPGTTFSIE